MSDTTDSALARPLLLLAVKPDAQAGELLAQATGLAAKLEKSLLVLSLVPKARGAAGFDAARDAMAQLMRAIQHQHPTVTLQLMVEPLAARIEQQILAIAEERAAAMVIVGRSDVSHKQRLHEGGALAGLGATARIPLLILPLAACQTE